MKGTALPVLASILISIGITSGCQQNNKTPRLDTIDQQSFSKSLKQVRAQVDDSYLKQFDQAIKQALHNYHIQKEYSLLPTSNPLHGLTGEEVMELPLGNQRQSIRRLRVWGPI